MKKLLLIIGVALLLVGLVWAGQGLGLITWPSSFMVSHIEWAYYGGCLAIVGAVIIWWARRG